MNTYAMDLIKRDVAARLSDVLSKPVQPDEIRYPPENIAGDLAFPCFPLARDLKKNPALISTELAGSIGHSSIACVERAEAASGYLNFFLHSETFCARVLEDFFRLKGEYGKLKTGAGKNVVVDLSSPNIAKPFSVGHLRSTNIGNALCNIMKHAGYQVIGDNHIGDWGTQFGKLIVAYKKWGDRTAIESDPIKELLKLYTRFHEEAGAGENEELTEIPKQSPLVEEARNMFKRLEEGDPEIVKLWEWIRELSLADFQKVYDMLEIKFDYVLGESFYNDKMGAVIELTRAKGILEQDSAGTILIRLDQFGISTPLLIQKKDGTSLYATRDLACVLYRIKKWDPDMILYVVGEEQQLYFTQLFKTLELLGIKTRCEHIYFGLIILPEGKLSTRKGRVIFLEDLIEEAIERAGSILEGRDLSPDKKEHIATIVGIGAIKYNDLSQNRKKTVTFEWDKMLSLEGNSSPYLQYSYARARSILRKAPAMQPVFQASLAGETDEIRLIKKLARFPEAVCDAAQQFYPHIIANYLFELAQQFSSFYRTVSVLSAENESMVNNRLVLTDFFSTVMKTGLGILGIDVLEEM